MNAIIQGLFSSRGAIFALVVFAIWFWRRPASSAPRRWLTIAAVLYLAASIYAVPNFVARLTLERGFRPFAAGDVRKARTAVVVLAGGVRTVRGWDHSPIAGAGFDTLERVLEAARVYHLIESDWVISTGGTIDPRQLPEAPVIRDLLVRQGVPEERILIEARSRTTREEAVLVEQMVREIHAEQVVLVTSSVHMRRSLAAFRAVGIEAIPAIAPEPSADSPVGERLVPKSIGLERSRAVAHELAGIVYYTVRGWCRF